MAELRRATGRPARGALVLDASVVVELLLGTPPGAVVARRIASPDDALRAPHLMGVEAARHDHEPFLPRVWGLREVTAYDGAHPALAEVLGAPLLTADHPLGGGRRQLVTGGGGPGSRPYGRGVPAPDDPPRPGLTPKPAAVVVGAGVGGLGAARALWSAGWDVRVLERARRLDPVGAGITLWPNAVRALDALGVHLGEHASRPGPGGLRTSGGRWLSRTDTADYPRRFGAPLVAVHRADLQQVLLDALPEGAVVTGARVTAVHQDGTGVTVEHAAGRDRAALVVIADGLGSDARRLVTGSATGPRHAGYTAWRAVTDAGAGAPEVPGTTESWGRGQRFGLVPLTDGRTYWFATANAPEGQRAPGGADGEHAEVLRRFAGWHDPVHAVLSATPARSVLRHDVYELAPDVASYVRGRLVLLGDAAHAMTPDLGQGACQALEDAATLGALVRPGGDVAAALDRYDRLRRPRARRISRRSRRIGILGQLSTPASTMARGLLVRATPDGAIDRQLAATLTWQPPATS